MSTIFILISCIAAVKMLIEAGQRASLGIRLAHGALYAAFIVLMHPVALSISKVAVDAYLSSPARLGDLALLALLDLAMTAALLTAHEVRWPNRRRMRYYGLLAMVRDALHGSVRFVPTVLAFFALFYFRLVLLFNLPGVSFWGVSLAMAAGVFLLSVFAPQICGWLYIQSKEALTCSLFIFAVVVVANVYAPQSQVVVQVGEGDWQGQLLHASLLLVSFGAVALVGYFLHRWWARRETRTW